ncbi:MULTISPECIES: hypothetical protein [Fischerella]|uniref:Uncharacterized protein n=1 Tax=Fischerella muscicola CCMEE 5323 TaxID=2019572 RepID=A0A2N6JVW5_FISMU|nr:hypothetical protein [Fischerella muscicola]MBD2432452.1 hypothetical protein [Fischerella sp. FACHB-380]PLZ83890.1 hypothetical protein CEN44_25925 [Fischerella muscicola CCMEE 5323]
MTFRTTEIQTLIADIDSLLSNKRLSRFLASEKEQPRQILERIRNFLVSCAETEDSSTLKEQQLKSQSSPLLTKFINQNNYSLAAQPNQPSQQAGSEANILSSLLAPLQAELQTLLQERANLVQEIKELEQRRLQNFSLAQQLANQEQLIANFLQVLSNRLGGNTQPKMPINILNSTPETPLALGEASSSSTSNKDNTEQFAFANSPTLEPQDQLERLTRLASELDQKLLALDGTVNVVFEALQRNIHTYHESLSQALARMYSQGLQGEQLFSNLINNLAQQAQLQFTAKEPFTIDIQKQTLANDSRTLQSSNKIEQLKTDGQTAEIDTVIAQLNQDTPNSPDTASDFAIDQLHQDSSVSIRDEVDQLYASLFGVDNLATSNPEFSSQQTNFEVIDSIENLLVEETATNQEKSDFTEALSVDEVKLANQEQAETFLQEVLFEVADPTELPVDEQASINQDEGELILQEVLFEVAEPRDFSVDEQATINQDEGELILQEVLFEVAESTELSTDEQVTNNQEELDLILQEVLFECADPTEELPVDAAASSDNMSIIDTQSAPTINEIQPVQPPVSASDPWFDEPDAGLLEGGNIQVEDTQKATNEKIREQLLELWEKITFTEAENETPSLPVEEPTADQITSLNNLSFNTSNEQPLTVNSVHESVISTTPDLTPTEENSGDRTLNDSSDNYIPASPQENLLIQAENQNAAIPEIALDAEQLLQLDQDLANFGEQTNPQLQPLTDLEIPDSAHSAQSVETENKESTTVSSEQMLSRDSNFGDDTEIRSNIGDYVWYLGIDIGTTGISATLLNRSTNEIYPLYWSTENQAETVSKTRTFRLPAEVYLPPAQEQDTTTSNLFSAQLKPYLQIALPYKNEQQKWEPILQFNEVATVPLVWVIRSLSKLLSTLKLDRSSTTLGLTAAGVGLNQQIFHSAINNLAGVICTCPSHWAEQYRFNIREALLLSKIIQHPQQVFFVEEAIASLLSELDGANGEIIQFGNSQESHSAKTSEYPLVGNTLVMNIGAAATEMALVDLPESLEELTHSDFMLHNFAYAGKGIEQDIICQLLLPTKWRKPRNSSHEGNNTTITSSPLQWQPMIAGVEQMSFASLGLEELKLPRPGEPDTSDRIKLQQRLESSVLGKAVLDAAVALKLILQHQESFTLELADQCWVLQRRDLESQVFVPFVRRLNRELNKLLVAKGIPTEAINQAILTGGTSSLAAVSRWLRQKLPNAKIIQDLYLNENGTPSCSRVAYGLAMLPLHPQVLEVPRQQYTDYFLFTELLRLIPDRALSFNEIIQLFEARGINTRSCQQRLLAFLEGELPPGLLPSNVDFSWLSLTSRENFDYKAIANAPLFEKQGSLTYRPNSSQLQSLRRHLDAIKGSTQQSLEEPYTVNFVINVSSQRVP